MQKLNLFGKRLAFYAFIGLSLVLPVLGQMAYAADFDPQRGHPGFGMLAIANGQTARLNVIVDRNTSRVYPPDPYRVTLYFLNGDGRILTQQSFDLAAQQSAFLDYKAPLLRIGGSQRIRPVVIAEADAETGIMPGFKPVVEVIDNATRRTAYVYPGRHNPPDDIVAHNPPGDYDSSIVGITRGQGVRLNVVNTADIYRSADYPPDPYRVTLSFYGIDGTLLAKTTKSLLPGQAATLNLNADTFKPNQDARLQFRTEVSVEPGPGGIVPCVMPSIEGFNLIDGKTAFLIPMLEQGN